MKTSLITVGAGVGIALVLSACGGGSAELDSAGKAACEGAVEMRTGGAATSDMDQALVESQAIMDQVFIDVRSSSQQDLMTLAKNADDNSSGVISFKKVVEVCRTLGYSIPDR